MEGLASCLPERVLCIDFFQRSHVESSTSQRGLHMLTWHLMAQLPPLQEPCAVKEASDEGYPSEFDRRDTKPWMTEHASD
jgi:hypothetical protein